MPFSQPFLFERRILPKVWGGRSLERLFGIALPAGERIGETWELYDRADGASRVRGGEATLADLLRQDRDGLLGRGVPAGHGGRFPLLLKFLDTQEPLSVQVHPDDAQARAEGDGGKNEALLVLEAGPRARLVHGLRAGVGRERFEAVGHTPAVEAMLHTFRPRAGDCVYVPAGLVHSTGPDVVGLEIQQNSDLTYRVYDWGRGRAVHVTKAFAAARYDAGYAPDDRPVEVARQLPDGGSLLVATPWFRVRRYGLAAPLELPTGGRYLAITVLGGRGTLAWSGCRGAGSLQVGPADTALVPAALPAVRLVPEARLDVVVNDPGES